ncbi:NAD(P)-binding domain-containing protein [Streptomyces sp. NBC_00237]|uniref:flavin-containing monooxygenase n=1 Tax=Streptomyces sp. NBC_00237 TaxID=2975687 RepID=UPI00224F1E85|nr:NAD(P)-binding domain-containing protein [Streptomyces sp. NBC_00237]MCX5205953.1 NAD(P)-binding domain-containing protein [Streptomyces sp. NBC_00237]
MRFPGTDGDRYPYQEKVVSYLTAYAARLDAEIRTRCRVAAVRRTGDGFEITLESGGRLSARVVVTASGAFGNPHRSLLPGLEHFTGQVLHAADYRSPDALTGRRVVVVGAGNSAVQIAAELAQTARVPLASRVPVKFTPQHLLGRDLHFWLTRTHLDAAPLGRLLSRPPAQPVLDDGRCRTALTAGQPDRRPLFTGVDGAKLLWSDGQREEVDTVLFATGYRPDLPYLATLTGGLDAEARPRHREGLSLSVAGPGFVGLEWQRGLSSNSLRGVGRDADRVARRLVAYLAGR